MNNIEGVLGLPNNPFLHIGEPAASDNSADPFAAEVHQIVDDALGNVVEHFVAEITKLHQVLHLAGVNHDLRRHVRECVEQALTDNVILD